LTCAFLAAVLSIVVFAQPYRMGLCGVAALGLLVWLAQRPLNNRYALIYTVAEQATRYDCAPNLCAGAGGGQRSGFLAAYSRQLAGQAAKIRRCRRRAGSRACQC